MRQIEIPAKTVIAPHETVPATVFRRAQDTPDETPPYDAVLLANGRR